MENFIEDTLNQLIEEAIDLKSNALDEFEKGKLFGYYFSILKIMSQAQSFGVYDKLSKSLQEYNPEDLLNTLSKDEEE